MPTYLNDPVSRDLTEAEMRDVKSRVGTGLVIPVMVEIKNVGTLYSTVQVVQPNGVRQNFGVTTELIADAAAAEAARNSEDGVED